MASKEETQVFAEQLSDKLETPSDYTFLIPHWDPVDSEQGLWWVKSQLWEGFRVNYRIDVTEKKVYLESYEYSHAILALPTDFEVQQGINMQVREFEAEWFPGGMEWPDDYWIIGEDGAGNYYFILKQAQNQAVYFYNHETMEKEDFEPSIERYYQYCKDIEIESGADL